MFPQRSGSLPEAGLRLTTIARPVRQSGERQICPDARQVRPSLTGGRKRGLGALSGRGVIAESQCQPRLRLGDLGAQPGLIVACGKLAGMGEMLTGALRHVELEVGEADVDLERRLVHIGFGGSEEPEALMADPD
jgi:hypothetical protein